MKKGEHHYELYCEHCNQVIVFKSLKAEHRHFITVGYWKAPSCTNAVKRLPLGRVPSEEEKLAIIEEQNEARVEAAVRRQVDNSYRKSDGDKEEYFKKRLKEMKESNRHFREKKKWEEENEYDCPKSMLDPLTLSPRCQTKAMHDPIQNKICGHTFDRSTLTQWFEHRNAEGLTTQHCPFQQDPKDVQTSCINYSFCLEDMEPNVKMKAEIDGRKDRKRREKAGKLTDEDKEEMQKEQDERDQEAKVFWEARKARWALIMAEKKKTKNTKQSS